METPVLTQSQRSKALSGNKSKQKKKSTKIRNVLANYSSRSSSVKLSEEHSISFEEKLSEIFQYTAMKKPKWNEIKLIPKEKRPELRAKLQKPKNPLMSNLIFGINGVSRSLEKQNCVLVLISNDINPPILTRHIHEGCSTQNIPLFEIPDLRKITQKCFGFPTIVIGFKKIIHDLIMIKEFFEMINPEIVINEEIVVKQMPVVIKPVVHKKKPMKLVEKQVIDETNDVYLFRENERKRCFVPPISVPKIVAFKSPLDFISLVSDEVEPNMSVYQNLKVKRVRPNPNRLKGKKKT